MVILISEDDVEVRTVMEIMLRDSNATVHSVGDGLEALKLLESNDIKFDVLVTDYNMPKMNGDDLVKEVFNKNIHLQKIIMMSGRFENSDEMKELAEQHSNIKFLFKPVSTDSLMRAIF